MFEQLRKATFIELQVWMIGAGLIGLSIGFFVEGIPQIVKIVVLAIGIAMHGWAMFRMYGKK